MKLFFKCAPTFEALSEPWVIMEKGNIEQLPQVIGPHQTLSTQCGITLSHLKEMNVGKAHGYLMGEIIYNDRLDESTSHITQVAWEIIVVDIGEKLPNPKIPNDDPVPDISLQFVPKGRHNCADEDCPK
jgi:hypothetical protein